MVGLRNGKSTSMEDLRKKGKKTTMQRCDSDNYLPGLRGQVVETPDKSAPAGSSPMELSSPSHSNVTGATAKENTREEIINANSVLNDPKFLVFVREQKEIPLKYLAAIKEYIKKDADTIMLIYELGILPEMYKQLCIAYPNSLILPTIEKFLTKIRGNQEGNQSKRKLEGPKEDFSDFRHRYQQLSENVDLLRRNLNEASLEQDDNTFKIQNPEANTMTRRIKNVKNLISQLEHSSSNPNSPNPFMQSANTHANSNFQNPNLHSQHQYQNAQNVNLQKPNSQNQNFHNPNFQDSTFISQNQNLPRQNQNLQNGNSQYPNLQNSTFIYQNQNLHRQNQNLQNENLQYPNLQNSTFICQNQNLKHPNQNWQIENSQLHNWQNFQNSHFQNEEINLKTNQNLLKNRTLEGVENLRVPVFTGPLSVADPNVPVSNAFTGPQVFSMGTIVTLRDAVAAVPQYDGELAAFEPFAEGCEEAKNMIDPRMEANLTKLIRNKLTGAAKHAIQGRQFGFIIELVNFLRELFAPAESLAQLQGKLGRLLQKEDESVVVYGNRARQLMINIFNTYARNGGAQNQFRFYTEQEAIRCFIRGLKKGIRVNIQKCPNLDMAIREAI